MKNLVSIVKQVQDYERKKLDKQISENLEKARRSRNLTASIKQLFKNRQGQV